MPAAGVHDASGNIIPPLFEVIKMTHGERSVFLATLSPDDAKNIEFALEKCRAQEAALFALLRGRHGNAEPEPELKYPGCEPIKNVVQSGPEGAAKAEGAADPKQQQNDVGANKSIKRKRRSETANLAHSGKIMHLGSATLINDGTVDQTLIDAQYLAFDGPAVRNRKQVDRFQ